MEQGDGNRSQSYRCKTSTPHTLCKVTPLFAERHRSVPRLGDIWIPKSVVTPNHFTRFYIPGVEDLFQIGDHLVKVEHGGSKSLSSVGEYGTIRKESGNSNKNPQMSKAFPFFHLILHP